MEETGAVVPETVEDRRQRQRLWLSSVPDELWPTGLKGSTGSPSPDMAGEETLREQFDDELGMLEPDEGSLLEAWSAKHALDAAWEAVNGLSADEPVPAEVRRGLTAKITDLKAEVEKATQGGFRSLGERVERCVVLAVAADRLAGDGYTSPRVPSS